MRYCTIFRTSAGGFLLEFEGSVAVKMMRAVQVSAPGGDLELVQRESPEPQ